MKVAALYSGGKDSNFALYLAQQNGLEVDRLITLLPQEESWMYHVPNIRWTSLQSRALGIPQVMEASQEGEEAELRALKRVLRKAHPEGLVVGAVASDYQYTRVNDVCEELGLWVYAPLWRKDPGRLLREYVGAGFRAIIVGASAEGMDESWLGRVIDEDACEALLDLSKRHGLHPVGEGGEFETLVLDGPNFMSRLEILEAEKEWKVTSGTLVIREAALVDKS